MDHYTAHQARKIKNVPAVVQPQVLVKGQPGARLELTIDFVNRRRHLPRITITRAA